MNEHRPLMSIASQLGKRRQEQLPPEMEEDAQPMSSLDAYVGRTVFAMPHKNVAHIGTQEGVVRGYDGAFLFVHGDNLRVLNLAYFHVHQTPAPATVMERKNILKKMNGCNVVAAFAPHATYFPDGQKSRGIAALLPDAEGSPEIIGVAGTFCGFTDPLFLFERQTGVTKNEYMCLHAGTISLAELDDRRSPNLLHTSSTVMISYIR